MTIWIDLDNTPHVPLFAPIIEELKQRGYTLLVTARDCFQVGDLARLLQVKHKCVGRHFGKNKFLKVAGLCSRGLQLLPVAAREKPDLAISHGSRSQLLVSAMLRIPSMLLMDYEFARGLQWMKPKWMMIPELIPHTAMQFDERRILRYPGIKEDVYVPRFQPDDSIRKTLSLDGTKLVVTLRPPATEAHYHVSESDALFNAVMDLLAEQPDIKTILLPRNAKQDGEIRRAWPRFFESGKILVPAQAVDGLNLLWHSDLAVSGGGTMNREAAALGVPVYSIFRGSIGAVDRYLAKTRRLVLLESIEDVRTKLLLNRRSRRLSTEIDGKRTLESIVDQIVAVAESKHESKRMVA